MKTKLIVIIAILAVSALLLAGCAAGVANPEGGQYGRGNTQDRYGDAQSDVCGDGIAQGGYGNAQANRAGSEAALAQEETGMAVTESTQLTEAELAGYGSAGALSDVPIIIAAATGSMQLLPNKFSNTRGGGEHEKSIEEHAETGYFPGNIEEPVTLEALYSGLDLPTDNL